MSSTRRSSSPGTRNLRPRSEARERSPSPGMRTMRPRSIVGTRGLSRSSTFAVDVSSKTSPEVRSSLRHLKLLSKRMQLLIRTVLTPKSEKKLENVNLERLVDLWHERIAVDLERIDSPTSPHGSSSPGLTAANGRPRKFEDVVSISQLIIFTTMEEHLNLVRQLQDRIGDLELALGIHDSLSSAVKFDSAERADNAIAARTINESVGRHVLTPSETFGLVLPQLDGNSRSKLTELIQHLGDKIRLQERESKALKAYVFEGKVEEGAEHMLGRLNKRRGKCLQRIASSSRPGSSPGYARPLSGTRRTATVAVQTNPEKVRRRETIDKSKKPNDSNTKIFESRSSKRMETKGTNTSSMECMETRGTNTNPAERMDSKSTNTDESTKRAETQSTGCNTDDLERPVRVSPAQPTKETPQGAVRNEQKPSALAVSPATDTVDDAAKRVSPNEPVLQPVTSPAIESRESPEKPVRQSPGVHDVDNATDVEDPHRPEASADEVEGRTDSKSEDTGATSAPQLLGGEMLPPPSRKAPAQPAASEETEGNAGNAKSAEVSPQRVAEPAAEAAGREHPVELPTDVTVTAAKPLEHADVADERDEETDVAGAAVAEEEEKAPAEPEAEAQEEEERTSTPAPRPALFSSSENEKDSPFADDEDDNVQPYTVNAAVLEAETAANDVSASSGINRYKNLQIHTGAGNNLQMSTSTLPEDLTQHPILDLSDVDGDDLSMVEVLTPLTVGSSVAASFSPFNDATGSVSARKFAVPTSPGVSNPQSPPSPSKIVQLKHQDSAHSAMFLMGESASPVSDFEFDDDEMEELDDL